MILPYLYPAWLIGFGMAFARAIGEYGSVVFIAGNMPMKTEIASLLIITKLTQYDYVGAAAIAFVLLLLSFALLLALNALQGWSTKRLGYEHGRRVTGFEQAIRSSGDRLKQESPDS